MTKYYCQNCDFKCSQKCDWDRHIIRPKHILNNNGNIKEIKKLEKNFFCNCGKKFKTNAGLWKHNKKCVKTYEEDEDNEYMHKGINIKDKDALVIHLLKQNSELHNKIIEMASYSTITNNNSNNTNNNAFNLNFFLHLWTFKTPNKKDIGLNTTSLYFN